MPPIADELKELTTKTDIEIEKVPAKELSEREEGVPDYKVKCEYDEATIERLRVAIFEGYDALKKERKDAGLEKKWAEKEAQYDGEMADDTGLEFNLSVPVTQVKCDTVERLALKAFMESDPKFTVTPRPETAKLDKWNVTVDRQADYLDYKLDESIEIESPLRKTLHQATLLDVGLLKIPYEYVRKRRKREETASGKIDSNTGRQEGVISFLKKYPESIKPGNEGHWVYKEILAGKEVTFKANFDDVVYDDPNPSFVDIRDLFVPLKTEGYYGLCDTRLTIERQDYSWWDLKKMEHNGDFINVDNCKETKKSEGDGKQAVEADDYKPRENEVIECVYWFDEKGNEKIDDEARITCWFHVKTKTFLGAIYYPYDVVECYYLPFYIKDKKPGFYKGGMGEDLTQSNLAQNAILNFMLTEMWQQLMTTPILREGSTLADQFLNKRWKPGVPIQVPVGTMGLKDDLDFLEKPQHFVGNQVMPILAFLGKYDADRTGVNDLQSTGANDPTDPQAPAAKTAMLLKASGINISDYINCLLPSFNLVGEVILGLTYQMSQKGRPYRQRNLQDKVVGGNPFAEISRDEMIAKTNIQSRAAGFDFDKINEKRENLALFQLIMPFMQTSPIYSQNVEGIYTLARTLIQSWSPMWKNKVDQILPSPQEIQGGTMKIAVQALQLYLTNLTQTAKVTGVDSKPELGQYLKIVSQLVAQAVNPKLAEEAAKK